MAEASQSRALPNAVPSSTKPARLVEYARRHGYSVDEFVNIIEGVT